MKTLRFIGMALIAVIMCVNFVACSDDDEEEANAAIEGTWKYSSSSDEDMRSGSFTFKSNGSAHFLDQLL